MPFVFRPLPGLGLMLVMALSLVPTTRCVVVGGCMRRASIAAHGFSINAHDFLNCRAPAKWGLALLMSPTRAAV